MMRLYHHTLSAPSRFSRLMLAEYDVAFELVEEQTWRKNPDFIAINPANSVPVLIAEAGVPIVGAIPIAEYIDETRGPMMHSKRLMPDYPLERAEVRRIIDWFTGRLDADVCRGLIRERVIKLEQAAEGGSGSPDSAVIRAAKANAKQHLTYLNWLAGTRNWLAGNSISAADLSAAASISVLDYMGEIVWQDLPAAREWYARVKSRPSFRALLSDRVRGLMPVSHYVDLDF
ncbi:MAG: glutathione S-transferase family protein [Pseudomonadota bacterium]